MHRQLRHAATSRHLIRRNRAVLAVATVAALAISAPVAAAAAHLLLATVNTATATTTLRTSADGPVLSLQNTGGSASAGLNVTVASGRPPITVNAGAGKATNLDADKLDGHDATDFVQGPVEGSHEIGTSGEPAWGRITLTSAGDPFVPVAFLKDPFGFVHLQGHVLAALDQPDGCDTYALFTLPAGYRPPAIVTEPAIAHDSAVFENVVAQIDVLANGSVELCSPRLTEFSWVALDGITFQAAP